MKTDAEKIIIQQMEFLHEASKTCGHTLVASVNDFSKAMAELARVIPLVRQVSGDKQNQSCDVV